ncbi:MAG: ATP-binding protein, partial [Bacteroidota bacterium]
MLPPRSLQIRRLLTRRYVVALALMAVLAVTEQVFVQTEFAKHLNNAREVNLAGRQRMLSQRLAKKAVAAAVAMETNVAALQAETALFAQVHRGLLDGDTEFELAGLQDPDLYADLDVLTEEVDRIEQSMAMLMTALAAGDSAATWHATQAAMAAETAFLPKMDRIVFRLAERTAVENQQARWIELVLLAATLVVLFMLGWLVFRPAATYAATAVNDAERQGRLLRAIIDTVPDHIYAKDLDGRATLRNVASAEALGYEHPEDGLGASDVDAPIEREVAHAVLEDDLRVVRTGTPVIDKEELFEVDGETRWLSTTKVPIFDASGAVTGLVGISRDITTSRAAKEALHDAKEAAEAATLAKSEFLANMSHEIRTPLNGVLGMTELLRETPLDDEQQEYIEVVHASGSALLSIINDVLDFSKIEAGHVELETQPFQLRTLIEDALDVVTVAATRAGLDLGYTVDPDVPTSLVGDAYRLRQVLTNLLSNAVKFTPGGGISVHVDLDAPPQHQTAALHIAVADTGIGIPAEKLDEVFGSFTQADASTTRQFGGTGLGLAISGHLIGLMGGELWAESEPKTSSSFSAGIPMPVSATAMCSAAVWCCGGASRSTC